MGSFHLRLCVASWGAEVMARWLGICRQGGAHPAQRELGKRQVGGCFGEPGRLLAVVSDFAVSCFRSRCPLPSDVVTLTMPDGGGI